MKKITVDQDLIASIENGADIYSRHDAEQLRDLKKKRPDFISICKAKMYKGSGVDKMPYFGAILTNKGREALLNRG